MPRIKCGAIKTSGKLIKNCRSKATCVIAVSGAKIYSCKSCSGQGDFIRKLTQEELNHR